MDQKTILSRIFPRGKNLNVVDIGCENGLELEEILRANPTMKITAIDLSPALLSGLRAKFAGKVDRITTVLGSYFEYDFGTAHFDGAVSLNSLHHFSKEEKLDLYRKICRGIKPGGFYIEADFYAPDQKYEDFCFEQRTRLRKEHRVREGAFYHHDTPCTVSNQTQMFFQAGFRSVELCFMQENLGIFLLKR